MTTYNLVESEWYTKPGDKYKTHSGDEYDTSYADYTCGKCGHDSFKLQKIDRSCPGCGSGGYLATTCAKCGAEND